MRWRSIFADLILSCQTGSKLRDNHRRETLDNRTKPFCRNAAENEVSLLLEWAAAEGWNPGLDDAAAFYAADPDGFFVAIVDDRPVAGVSVIRQGSISGGPGYGFLGLYLCLSEYRGKGLGWAVWQAGINYLAGCTVALDGVVDQQDNYRKSGFELAYRNIRFSGRVPEHWSKAEVMPQDGDTVVRPVLPADLDQLVELDRSLGGVERRKYLSHWFGNTDNRQTLLLEQRNAAGAVIVAAGTIRRCIKDYKIGPLLAPDATSATRLLMGLCARVGAENIVIDVPEPNGQAMALVANAGLQPVFETARMYKGIPPEATLDSIFAVCTLELG